MKIAFDISAQLNQKTGIGYYQYRLLKSILKLYPHHFFELFAIGFLSKRSAILFDQKDLNYRFRLFRIPSKLLLMLWAFVKKPYLNRLVGDVDIYHVSEWMIPPIKKGKKIAFVHDLTPLLFPEHHTFFNVLLNKYRFYFIGQVDAVLTNSFFTKGEMLKYLPIDSSKIQVTHLAADPIFRPMSSVGVKKILHKYRLQKPYLLSVCTLEPRKNLLLLIEVYLSLRKRKCISHDLVLVGRLGWKYKKLLKLIKDSNFSDSIHCLGYVDEVDLPALINGATLFVYPSLYEGFGLPILEAMQCGTPVLCSSTSSMPEVGGHACFYADPYSKEDWEEQIKKLVHSPDLLKKASRLGVERSRLFSWDFCAKRTMNFYLKLFKKKTR